MFNDKALRRKLNSATHLPVAVELFRQLLVQWISLTNVVVCSRLRMHLIELVMTAQVLQAVL